jgi:hypothetical protein
MSDTSDMSDIRDCHSRVGQSGRHSVDRVFSANRVAR